MMSFAQRLEILGCGLTAGATPRDDVIKVGVDGAAVAAREHAAGVLGFDEAGHVDRGPVGVGAHVDEVAVLVGQ
jgi:hypothetical protein